MEELSVEYDVVGGLEHDFYDFPYIGSFIIPTDELVFFRGVAQNHQAVLNDSLPSPKHRPGDWPEF